MSFTQTHIKAEDHFACPISPNAFPVLTGTLKINMSVDKAFYNPVSGRPQKIRQIVNLQSDGKHRRMLSIKNVYLYTPVAITGVFIKFRPFPSLSTPQMMMNYQTKRNTLRDFPETTLAVF